jgi:arylsulfatase A-like enzyme
MLHGVHIYEEGVRVPFIVRWPGRIAPGIVVPGPVRLTDLAPTVLDLLDVPSKAPAHGRSIAGALTGSGELDSERPIHLYRREYPGGEVAEGVMAKGEKFGLRRGRWKLIEGPEEGSLELFDLVADPDEKTNLADGEPERTARMRAEIEAWRRAHTREIRDDVPLSPEDRAGLEALGYSE